MKNFKILLASITIIFVASCIWLSCSKDQLSPATTGQLSIEDSQKGKKSVEVVFKDFSFKDKELVAKWDAFIKNNDVHVVQLTWDVYDETGTVLYGGGETFGDSENHLVADVLERFKSKDPDIIQATRRVIASLESRSEQLNQSEMEMLSNQKKQLSEYTSKSLNLKITSLMLSLPEQAFSQLVNLTRESNGEISDIFEKMKNKAHRVELRDNVNWTPDQGAVYVYPESEMNRTVYNLFIWLTKPVPTYGYTYEHDFFLNNSTSSGLGPGTYLSRAQNSQGFPVCTWSTNMPNKYLDTRLFDENNWQGAPFEVPYTIGCLEFNNIQKNITYWSLMTTTKGDTNTDNGKLNAQLGLQIPLFCPSVWCSFSKEQINLIQNWIVPVPGSWFWAK